MIGLNTLCEQIENTLNENEKGIHFKIFGDTGDFQKAVKQGAAVTEYVNGLAQIVQSATTTAQTLVIATESVRLQFAFAVENYVEQALDEIIYELRGIFSSKFEKAFAVVLSDENGTNFSVGVSAAPLNSGERNMLQWLGDSFTLVTYISYSFIENGVNSLNCPVYLDGVQLPYDSLTITRNPTVEGNPYNTSQGDVQNRVNATALSVDLMLPATTKNVAGDAILHFILAGGDAVHELKLVVSEKEEIYPVVLGETNVSMQGADNAGHKVSFVEAMDYGEV